MNIPAVAVLSTSDISKLIGLPVTVAYIKKCGVEPVVEGQRTVLWRKSDVPAILRGIATHLNGLADAAV